MAVGWLSRDLRLLCIVYPTLQYVGSVGKSGQKKEKDAPDDPTDPKLVR